MRRSGSIVAAIVLSLPPAAVQAADAADAIEAPPALEPPPPLVGEPPSVVVEPPAVGEPPPLPAPPAATPAPPASPVPNVAATATVLPTPRPKRDSHGLALAAGFGITYGFLGLQARYDLPLRRSLTVSPFVSAGLLFGALSGPAGFSTAFGERHRFAVDVGVAPLWRSELVLHGTTVADRIIYGPLIAAGYEHMSDGGWFQRTTIEYAYATWGSAVPIQPPRFALFGGLAIGRRIW
jgi:hypothetical protein